MKKIKVGIAGLGRSGWDIHAKLIEPLSRQYEIIAAFDKLPERTMEAEKRFGCRIYNTYKKLVADEEIELIVIAVPNKLHQQYSIMAMEAGKDVVCEKPMATRLKDAEKMLAVSKKAKRILAVFHNRRYEASFVTVKNIIDSGVLGRIVEIKIAYHRFTRRWDWQSLKKFDGGDLNNAVPHFLDQALVLFGGAKPSVFCLRDKTLTLGDADDHAKVILYGKGHPTVEVETTSANAYPQNLWTVMGTQGSLTGNTNTLQWKYFDPEKIPHRKVETEATPDRSYNSEKIDFIEKSWKLEDFKGPGAAGFYLDLYESITKNKKLHITPESVLLQMQVLEECRRQTPF